VAQHLSGWTSTFSRPHGNKIQSGVNVLGVSCRHHGAAGWRGGISYQEPFAMAYYCTSCSWPTYASAHRVQHSWLHDTGGAQRTTRYGRVKLRHGFTRARLMIMYQVFNLQARHNIFGARRQSSESTSVATLSVKRASTWAGWCQ